MRSCFRRGLADATVRYFRKMNTKNNTLSMKFTEDWKGYCWSFWTWSVISGRLVSHRAVKENESHRKRSSTQIMIQNAIWEPSILYETTNLISLHITRYIDEQFVDSMWIKLLTKNMRHGSMKYLIPRPARVIVITFPTHPTYSLSNPNSLQHFQWPKLNQSLQVYSLE